MSPSELQRAFSPVLDDVEDRSSIAGRFIDKTLYQIYIATLWANVVLNPDEVGIQETDLPALHEILNKRLVNVLGPDTSITTCYQFINSKSGETAMDAASLTKTHRELLLYFSSMILDPEGHKRWMEDVSNRSG